MPAPKWRTVIAADGETRVATIHHVDGSFSIRLTSGAVSIVSAVTTKDLAYLLAAPAIDEPLS